jgi:hypothetical protein
MTRFSRNICFVAGLIGAAGVSSALSQDNQFRRNLDALVAAYPEALAGYDGKMLHWRDGTIMPVSGDNEDKTLAELLHHASIIDQFRIPYPRGQLKTSPAVDIDPGRLRDAAFFTKMYGECKSGQVSRQLADMVWLPKTWGKKIRITSVNEVNKHLSAVSEEIDATTRKDQTCRIPHRRHLQLPGGSRHR